MILAPNLWKQKCLMLMLEKKSVTVCFGTGLERGGLWLDGWIVPPLLPLLPTCQQTVVAVSHSKHVEIFLLKNELKRFTFLQQFHNSMETRTWNLDKVNWIWMLKLARKWENGMNPLLQVSKDQRSGPGYQCVGCWRSCCGRWGGAPPSECAAQCPTSSWSSGSLSGWGFCIFPPDPPPAGWVSSCELAIQPASGPRADTWFDLIESGEWEIRAKWKWNVIHCRNGSHSFVCGFDFLNFKINYKRTKSTLFN